MDDDEDAAPLSMQQVEECLTVCRCQVPLEAQRAVASPSCPLVRCMLHAAAGSRHGLTGLVAAASALRQPTSSAVLTASETPMKAGAGT